MGRKVAWAMALVVSAVVSAGLVGGQVGGFLWWGTHEPIYIYGDEGFSFDNGVMSGSGTEADPYIIEGWSIVPANADYGVYVDHTTKHFVIRDCVVEGARIAGVYLNSVENGRIEKVQVWRSDAAVFLLNSENNRISDSVIAECRYGVVMSALSKDNVIVGNTFLDNGISAYDPMGWNSWTDGKTGNYWSDYEGVDQNKDGVGDEPYYPVGDTRPLLKAPAELTQVEPAGPSYAGNLVAPDGSLVVTSQTPITLTANDPGSGLAEIKYSIDGGAWTAYTAPILLKGDDGLRKVTYYGVDKLGNAEPKKTVSFLLDNHPPTTAMDIGDPKFTDSRGTWVTSSTQITLRRTQESSYGRSETYYRINDGAWLRYSGPFRLTGEDGARAVSFYSRNASGVVETAQTKTLLKDDAPPTSRGAKPGAPSASAAASSPAAASGSKPAVTATTPTTTTSTPSATPKPAAPAATTPAPSASASPKPAAATPPATTPTPASSTTAPKDGTVQAELSGAALGQTGASTTAPAASPTQTESKTAAPSTPASSSPAPNASSPSPTPGASQPATPPATNGAPAPGSAGAN